MKSFCALLVAVLLSSCSGSRSTLQEGFAYRMTAAQAKEAVVGAITAHIAADYMQPAQGLAASGYRRRFADTHTFNATAIRLARFNAFAFEVTHTGSMLDGPKYADRIYASLLLRADALGKRAPLPKQ